MTGTARGVSTLTILCLMGGGYGQVTKKVPTVRVDTTPGHEVNTFDPDQAIGSSMDNLPYGAIDKIYSPAIIKQCLSAGYGPITYRNNTELRMAAWHWNENGAWSDAVHKSGYFTGSTELKASHPLYTVLLAASSWLYAFGRRARPRHCRVAGSPIGRATRI